MSDQSLVSCVMVTGKTPAHQKLDQAAISSFLEQTYENKELLIINDGDYRLFPNGAPDSIRELDCRIPGRRMSLGELRNVGLTEARGDWIAQWDSDDFSHPSRLFVMMAHRQPAGAVVLRCQVRYSLVNNTAKTVTAKRGIAGTILHAKTEARYEPAGKHEDSWFLDTFGTNRVIVENVVGQAGGPQLYIRLYHGANTWSAKHIMQELAYSPNRWTVSPAERDYLKTVLQNYYGVTPKVPTPTARKPRVRRGRKK